MALSRKQSALIHIAKKQLGLTDEQYRTILRVYTGFESSKHLDQRDFEAVMQHMAALGFRSDFTKSFYGQRPGMASPRQVALIRKLWGEYTGDKGDDSSLGKWLTRTFKVSSLRFVTHEQAPKAIAALKAMAAKKAGTGQAAASPAA